MWDTLPVKFPSEGLPWAAQSVPVSQNLLLSHSCPNFQERTYLQSSPRGSDAISRTEWSGNERVSPLIMSPSSTEKERILAQWKWDTESLSVCNQGKERVRNRDDLPTEGWGGESALWDEMHLHFSWASNTTVISCSSASSIHYKLWESKAWILSSFFFFPPCTYPVLVHSSVDAEWLSGPDAGTDEFLLLFDRKGDSGCWLAMPQESRHLLLHY